MKTFKINHIFILLFSIILFGLLPIDILAQTDNTSGTKIWTDEEIIELGYIPDEVIVKFKKERVDLKTSTGQTKSKPLISQGVI